VDDLCEAIFRVLALENGTSGTWFLGDPQGLSLRAFLQEVSLARRGRRRLILPVPLWPVERAARAAEALRIPFPVTRSNLQGLRAIQPMETARDLERLGLKLRGLGEGLAGSNSPGQEGIPLEQRPAGVILVGGGRIGVLHAITASRQRGMRLLAVVDRNPAALSLLSGMGLQTLFTKSLDAALGLSGVDAVILATPPESHLELTRRCLSRGLRVLVEKPLAIRPDQLEAYHALAREFPGGSIQGGYLAPRYPQARYALDRLRAGGYGRVRSFQGFTLLSQVLDARSRRWEVQRCISGGGVLINSGGHVLSLVRAAFGDPEKLSGQSTRLFSREVEDSFCAELSYPGFRGQCYASWSIEAFPRQENRLIVETDAGTLTLTNNATVFEKLGGEVEITTQMDFDIGFNFMPDYAGGGIAQEHLDLQASVRGGVSPPVGLRESTGIEEIIFRLYGCAREVKSFAAPEASPDVHPRRVSPLKAALPRSQDLELVLDLREVSAEEASASALREASERWSSILLLASQTAFLGTSLIAPERIRITVPDFLHQARLIAAGLRLQLLSEWGPWAALAAFRSAVPAAVAARGPSFWAVANGLLAADLSRIPRAFKGALLIHPYLVDLAIALRRPDDLRRMIAQCRRRAPQARVGLHTNLLKEALEVLALGFEIDDLHFLSSPSSPAVGDAVRILKEEAPSLRLTAEVGPAPAVVHRVAAADPARWARGGTGLLVGSAADPAVAALREARILRAWSAAFPGLPAMEGIC
jgi:predicted dehydrogenase